MRVAQFQLAKSEQWESLAVWNLAQLKDLCAYARSFETNKTALPTTKSELHKRWVSTRTTGANLRADLQAKTAAAVAADAGVVIETEGAPGLVEQQAEVPEAEVVQVVGNETPVGGAAEPEAAPAADVGPLVPAAPSKTTSHLVMVGDTMRDGDDMLRLVALEKEESEKKSKEKMSKVHQSMRRQTKNATRAELQILRDLCFGAAFDAAE